MEIKNVNRQLLFPTLVWLVEYGNFESVNRGILDEMSRVDWKSEHERSGRMNEVRGRFMEDVFITPTLVPSAAAIVEAFINSCEHIAEELDWDLANHEIRVSDLWAHVTPPGKSTQQHHHFPDHLSCAYYVRAPEACGNLRLLDDRKCRVLEPHSGTNDAVMAKFVEIPATEGLMVIFPSWLSHQVGENQSNESRVSISMNAALVPKGSAYGMRR